MTENKKMTVEEHIGRLAGDYKCWNNTISHEEALEIDRIFEEFKDLKEKSVARKVVDKHEAQSSEDIEFYGEDTLFGYCPKCNALICSLWNEINCGDCGQKLDWSEG